jgi:Pentapeptide repeats (9 copies)
MAAIPRRHVSAISRGHISVVAQFPSAAPVSPADVSLSATRCSEGGRVTFRDAVFGGGRVTFGNAQFTDGTVNFTDAQFTGGTVNFKSAKFSGSEVDFSRAKFSGSEVDFSNARDWSVPPVFPWTDTPLRGVKLPKKEDQSQA